MSDWPRVRVLLMLVGVLSTLGCEGLGRELVDELPGGALNSCGLPVPCSSIDSNVEPIAGLPPSPTAGPSCPDPYARAHLGTQSVAALNCLRWELPAEGELIMANVQLTQVELVITAARPARVTFEGARLASTRIELRGPVSLRFVAASTLENVHVIDATDAIPSLSLVESEARGLVLGGDEETFDGEMIATRSRVAQTKLLVSHLTLENTAIDQAEVAAERLVAHTIEGKGLRLQVERGALAGASISAVRVERCGSLLITSSALSAFWLAPCREPLRIDRTSLKEGAAAGRIESKDTSWRRTMFAGGLATELEAWLGVIAESSFCGGTQRVATSGRTHCNECGVLGASAGLLMCKPSELGDANAAVDATPSEDASRPEEPSNNPSCPALDALPACMPSPIDEFPF